MNYTDKCHLPQWEEQDRVLRTDFNSAFAVLEKIGVQRNRLQTVTENLARDAYRREIQHRIWRGRGGELDGMWINTLASREEAGGDGRPWNGKYGLCYGLGGMPTLEGCRAAAKEECYACTVPTFIYKSNRAAVTFVSDGIGTLTGVDVWTVHDSRYINDTFDFTFFITLTRLDTGEEMGTAGPFTTNGKVEREQICPVSFPLESGVEYRLSFSLPEGHHFKGEAGFALKVDVHIADTLDSLTFAPRETENQVVKTVVPAGENAIGLVRWTGDGGIALAVDGQRLTPVRSRESVNALGEGCTETEFSLEALPEEGFSLELLVEKGEGDLQVFDYGLIWR